MWAKFKAFGWKGKLGILAALLAIAGAFYATYNQAYKAGVGVAATQLTEYKNKSLALSKKLAEAQTKVDTRVVTEYKDRISYVDRVVYKNRTIIDSVVPEQFKLSNGWIYAYNQSAIGAEIDPTKASDAYMSNVSDKAALSAIAGNNGICLSNQAQLDALQKWILETEASRAKVTK